ncbi:MAG TPA: hypothetical protein VI757_03475 [Bacteroidia bacterium]|nr:hypothetical protein [Bacteroidia bacterium]
MKNKITHRLLLFAFCLLQISFVQAQVPQAINCQAVARNTAGNVLMNQTITVRLTVEQGSAGTPLYVEVEQAAKQVGYDFSGVDAPKSDKDLYGLRYAEFVVPLVKAVQALSNQNEEFKKENAQLLKRIEALETCLPPRMANHNSRQEK